MRDQTSLLSAGAPFRNSYRAAIPWWRGFRDALPSSKVNDTDDCGSVGMFRNNSTEDEMETPNNNSQDGVDVVEDEVDHVLKRSRLWDSDGTTAATVRKHCESN